MVRRKHGVDAVEGQKLRVDLSCMVDIMLFSDSLCQPTDSTAAIIGGVVAALFAVFVIITVIICVVVFVRRYQHSDQLNR